LETGTGKPLQPEKESTGICLTGPKNDENQSKPRKSYDATLKGTANSLKVLDTVAKYLVNAFFFLTNDIYEQLIPAQKQVSLFSSLNLFQKPAHTLACWRVRAKVRAKPLDTYQNS
jgi:hypothetical protein